jgi:hypothetical protein
MEISGSGHLDFDRALSLRSKRVLRIDLERVDHVNLYGLMGMAVAVMAAKSDGLAISIAPPKDSSACNFISRLGFDRFIRDVADVQCEMDLTSSQQPGHVLVEMRLFRSGDELQPLYDLLEDRLAGVAGPQSHSALIEALWELGGNAVEHSGAPGIAAAVVQGAKRRDTHVDFVVADAGKGIRQSFLEGSRGLKPTSDHEALTLALEYLVSSVKDPGRGQGLATTVEQATGLRGRVMIRSGDARRLMMAETGPSGTSIKPAPSSVPPLRGTIVAVSLPCR